MQIDSLVLKGFKRFRLNPVEHFELTATSLIQVIIGTNGSGKSSIMSEWSFLPANASDFKKGGCKIVSGSHNGSKYRMESHFKSSPRHSFYKDDVALVDMGTASAVFECCRSELGLTRDVLDLIQGRVKFTTMSPAKRKDWIMRLSGIDLTFLIGFHETIKVGLRDTVGTVKHIGKRLSDELSKYQALVVDELAGEKIALIKHELNDLLLARNETKQTYGQYKKDIDGLIREITEINGRAEEALLGLVVLDEFDDLSQIAERGFQLSGEIKQLRERLAGLTDELLSIESHMELLKAAGSVNLQDTSRNIEDLVKIIERRCNDMQFPPIANANAVYQLLLDKQDHVIGVVKDLPAWGPQYSQTNSDVLTDELRGLTQTIQQNEVAIAKLSIRIDGLKEIHLVNCPNCKHEFKPGVGADEISTLQGQLNNRTKNNGIELLPRKEILEKKLNAISEYNVKLNRLRSMMFDLPELKSLWDFCIEREVFLKQPGSFDICIHDFFKDIAIQTEIDVMANQLEDLEKQKMALEQLDNSDLNQYETRYMTLESIYHDEANRLSEMQKELELMRSWHRSGQVLQSSFDQLVVKTKSLREVTDKAITALRNEHIDVVVGKHHEQLAVLSSQLTAKQSSEEIVNFLQKQFDDLQIEQRGLKTLIDAVSPSSGLIAEQLLGFIHAFTGQLNDIISEFWNYDIDIQPCASKEGELDFYFPFKVEGDVDQIPDINAGSEAQLDLFDFAFRIVACGYLNLIDYPLYADELGRTFDEEHRNNLITYIKRLMDGRQFSQLLLISHYAANHSAMQHAEVCVVDSQNITMHSHYNKHVIFK